MIPATLLGKWARRSAEALFSAINYLVFLFLDCVECVLCPVYRFLDSFFDGEVSSCYCVHGGEVGEDQTSSESLYRRENVFRQMGFLNFRRKDRRSSGSRKSAAPAKWSDCRCEVCLSWTNDEMQNLHVVVREPSRSNASIVGLSIVREVAGESNSAFSSPGKKPENVIFLHGFLSSSSMWTESVFSRLSESGAASYRLFAVDLFGFGKSPKPSDCSYTLRDHVEMIEKSVIDRFRLDSFHIVAHSMGCVIAVALASKHQKSAKSVTLMAPPYFPSRAKGGGAGLTALRRLAEKRLWPPLLFGSSVMSWYEHLGRCVCFVVCRNHRTWERILKLVTRRSELHFAIVDLTRHTHHSAWHTMHNVICGGMSLMDGYLDTLRESGLKISVVHGDRDRVVPLECSIDIKARAPGAELKVIPGADHNTVIFALHRNLIQVEFLRR